MLLRSQFVWRKGTIIPLMAITLVGLMGFVALAIDVGVMMVARTQCQEAADAAAMAGARTLDGNATTSNNKANAVINAKTAAEANWLLSQQVQDNQVSVTVGKYYYKPSTSAFVAWPVDSGSVDNASEPWTLVTATVSLTNASTFFGNVLGDSTFSTSATAVAVHRPRDVTMIVDLSGSMRFDSLLGVPLTGNRNQSMNPETAFPQFGHYSATSSAGLQFTTNSQFFSGEIMGAANDVAVTASSGYSVVNDFYQDATAYGTTTPAFTSAGDGDATGWVAGDQYLKINLNQGVTYAKTVQQVLNTTIKDSAFETSGYEDSRFGSSRPSFAGYVQGPRYWGKTFFIWPPDPRPSKDWRKVFFFKKDGVSPLDDNTLLWDSSGNWGSPNDGSSDQYRINYTAILNWIKNTGPNPFPPRLRAGGILYYDAIPTTIDTSVFPPTDANQRFWKEYIDEMLGLQQTGGSGSSPIYQVITPRTGYGDDYSWGTPQITSKPSSSNGRYMDYNDNPLRPKVHFWFGPMSMIDFMDNYNMGRFWWPGTVHEAPTWQCKVGMQAALMDIENNHPNDRVALTFFSSPKDSFGADGYYNQVRVPLGVDYNRMLNSLWFSPRLIDTPTPEIRLYDNSGNDITRVPRANGSTCYAMPLMLTYNQFSGNSALQSYATGTAPVGQAGGNGRKGTQKMIIFETDGMVNTTASASFTNSGPYNSFYNVRIKDPNNAAGNEYPTGVAWDATTAQSQSLAIVDQICALDSASSPGYSTPSKPVIIHCIAYGSLFDSTNTSSYKTNALSLLQNIQFKGGQAGGEQPTTSTPLANYKIIVGPYQQRIQDLQSAIGAIMQSGVQVSLIR